MDDLRSPAIKRQAEWLARIGAWAGSRSMRPAALACEVVRGIVDPSEDDYAAGVAWAGRELTADDYTRALGLYGPHRLDAATLARLSAERLPLWSVR